MLLPRVSLALVPPAALMILVKFASIARNSWGGVPVPASCSAGAAVLASEEFVVKYGLQNQAVEIVGMAMVRPEPNPSDLACDRARSASR
jgi:hypothetical protein